jgi:hypothetical protein
LGGVMTVITSNVNTYTANSVAPTTTSGSIGVPSTTTTAKTSITISTTNSSTVKVSAAALTVAKAATVATPMSVAQVLATGDKIPAGTIIKDTAANISTNLKALSALSTLSAVTGITLSDTKAGTINVARSDVAGDLSDAQNTGPNLAVLKKITSSYVLNVSGLSVSDALTLKSPAQTATLSLSIRDTVDNITASLTALQTAAKAKSITGITIPASTAGTPKPNLTITAAQLKASPELLATIKGDYDLTITGVLAADAVTVAGNADKVLKASGSQSTQAKVAISDTSANLVKSIAALEIAATAGRLTSITVSDGKALVVTQTQIKASEKFLNVTFTGNAVVEVNEVSVSNFSTLEGSIEDNQSLILGKQSIKDTAANIQAKLDQLDAAVEAGSATSASGAFVLSNIAVSDKGTITVTNSNFLKDLDALKVISGTFKLNVTDINVSDALAIKAPSKDATLAISVKDTAANIAANWDKLQAVVKAKTLTSISVTDSASSLLTMTAAQLKANVDVLNVVTGDYKLAVTGVAAADVAKTLTTKNIYSVEVKDTAANILKNLTSIQTAVTAAKIQSVIITDAANPSLSIADIFALTTTLPNVTLAAGVKFNVKDTANMIIAHARYDIGDVIKNAGSIALSDKTPPNLTLADATTLKGLINLAAGTKYNVADGGALIAAQAALSGEKVLDDAASVVVNKNFTIDQAKVVSAIKSLAKGSAYSINDTADKILTQSALAGETVLSKANAVNVVDTSANILAKLDQLQVLAKAGKIADIKFTDTPSGALPLTDAQMLNNAEAIGKIISPRTMPTLSVTKPVTPPPLGPALPPMKTLKAWSAETTLGTIVDGSYQFRPYMRADRWGNMIGDLVTPATSYNASGQNPVSFYLMAQDGLGNTSAPLKIADFNTSLGVPGTLRNGGIYLLKPNIYANSYTPNMVDNQLAVWMEQQPDNSYNMKYLPFSFSPALAAADSTASPVATTGTATTLVSGIDPQIIDFNWVNNLSGSKFLLEYETRTPNTTDKKDIYINTFSVNGSGNNVALTTANKIASGANSGARLLISGLNANAKTFVYNNPLDSSIIFAQETTKGDRAGLLISNLDATNGLVANTDRFLDLGASASGIKINDLTFGGVSTDPAVSTASIAIMGATTTVPPATPADKPVYKIQFFKTDAALSGTGGTANITATDGLTLNNQVKAIWNQGGIGSNTTLFAFQDGNVVHAVQVGSDGKIITDDQFAIPTGATFDRYRPLGSAKSTSFEFIWREPVPGTTTGETVIKTRIYDTRGSAPITLSSGNAFNLLAGAAGNDTLIGRGNDVMSGGPGSDLLTGMVGGKDVASYLGKSTDYKITPDSTDPFKVIVKDLRSGSPDGIDTLTNISAIRFADQTISLIKTSTEKSFNQNFLSISPGITSAIGTSAKGYIALNGTETGTLSVRLISGNGSLPASASNLVDAIVNATTASAFKTAVQAAKTQGANAVPPFTLDIAKTLTTPVDINVDGTKDTGVRVPLDINMQSTTVGDVSLVPRSVTSLPQQIGVALNQSFISVIGGPGLASGTSGANNSWLSNLPYNFAGSEQYTLKLFMGTRDGVSALPASVLKLAANVTAATTPQAFNDAMQTLWNASYNGSFWVGFNAALANPIDINGDSKADTGVGVQMNYYGPSSDGNSITLSAVPNYVSKAATQSFLKLLPGTANGWGYNGGNTINGKYTVTGQETGTLYVNIYTNDSSPLPSNYSSLQNAVTSAISSATFDAAMANIVSANLGYSFTYNLNGTADLLGNGTQVSNVNFSVTYLPNLNTSSGLISFIPV